MKVAVAGEPDRKSGKEFLRAREVTYLREGYWPDSAEPGTKIGPDDIGENDRKISKEPLSDKADLDKPVVSIKFSPHCLAVLLRLPVQVLIA